MCSRVFCVSIPFETFVVLSTVVSFIRVLGPFCFTSTEPRWLIRDGDGGGGGGVPNTLLTAKDNLAQSEAGTYRRAVIPEKMLLDAVRVASSPQNLVGGQGRHVQPQQPSEHQQDADGHRGASSASGPHGGIGTLGVVLGADPRSCDTRR